MVPSGSVELLASTSILLPPAAVIVKSAVGGSFPGTGVAVGLAVGVGVPQFCSMDVDREAVTEVLPVVASTVKLRVFGHGPVAVVSKLTVSVTPDARLKVTVSPL